MEIIKVKFNRCFFTTLEARMYLKEHNIYPYMRVIRTDTDYVYIIRDENLYTNHTSKSVGNGIRVKYGYY